MRKRNLFPFLVQFLLHARKQRDIFLDRKAADKAKHRLAVVGFARAFGGMEKIGVDAARHQMAGPAGDVLEQRAEFGIGREKDLRHGVEPGRGRHGQVFDLLSGGSGMAVGQQAQKPIGAARRVLVHVGVPTGGKGQTEVVREPRAQEADFAGAGDVNQVGLEALEHFADERNVAQKRGIEAQIFFESERRESRAAVRGSRRCRLRRVPGRGRPARTHRKGRLRRRAKASKWRLVWATPFTSWNESGK